MEARKKRFLHIFLIDGSGSMSNALPKEQINSLWDAWQTRHLVEQQLGETTGPLNQHVFGIIFGLSSGSTFEDWLNDMVSNTKEVSTTSSLFDEGDFVKGPISGDDLVKNRARYAALWKEKMGRVGGAGSLVEALQLIYDLFMEFKGGGAKGKEKENQSQYYDCVTLFVISDGRLNDEDPKVADAIIDKLREGGVRFVVSCLVSPVWKQDSPQWLQMKKFASPLIKDKDHAYKLLNEHKHKYLQYLAPGEMEDSLFLWLNKPEKVQRVLEYLDTLTVSPTPAGDETTTTPAPTATATLPHHWHEISRDELGEGTYLGHGRMGQVTQHKWRGTDVAVKRIPPSHSNRDLIKELEILATIRHPNLVLLMGGCTSHPSNEILIVTELAPLGSLDKILNTQQQDMETRVVNHMGCDILRGLAYLHQMSIIHRDIKPANILVFGMNLSYPTAKIADFGFARFLPEKGGEMTEEKGTPRYMSPEVLQCRTYDIATDIFSFGFVLFEMLYGRYPIEKPEGGVAGLTNCICEGNWPAFPTTRPGGYEELIRSCWAVEPKQRPTSIAALETLEQLQKVVT